MKLKKYEKNPIIAPNPANAWENLVTCNPGVIYDDGRFYMLYRAAGDDKEHVIRLGLAVSENGFDFRRVGDSPVFGPSADGPDGGCVEDPRIVKFDNEFYITYAYRAHAPGSTGLSRTTWCVCPDAELMRRPPWRRIWEIRGLP